MTKFGGEKSNFLPAGKTELKSTIYLNFWPNYSLKNASTQLIFNFYPVTVFDSGAFLETLADVWFQDLWIIRNLNENLMRKAERQGVSAASPESVPVNITNLKSLSMSHVFGVEQQYLTKKFVLLLWALLIYGVRQQTNKSKIRRALHFFTFHWRQCDASKILSVPRVRGATTKIFALFVVLLCLWISAINQKYLWLSCRLWVCRVIFLVCIMFCMFWIVFKMLI